MGQNSPGRQLRLLVFGQRNGDSTGSGVRKSCVFHQLELPQTIPIYRLSGTTKPLSIMVVKGVGWCPMVLMFDLKDLNLAPFLPRNQ
jgi:hypothetical protein